MLARPPPALSPVSASSKSLVKTSPLSSLAPMVSANSQSRSTHSLMSDVQLLQCTMATASPTGVVTRSISGTVWSARACSSTTMENTEVPALTLPVRGATEFVAIMPVPASPSGGHTGQPGSRSPSASSSLAPSAVSVPACSPATRMAGSRSSTFQATPCSATRASNFSIMAAS